MHVARAERHRGRAGLPAQRPVFHRRYASVMHTAHGRYPAAIAVASSAKKTRRFAYPRASARTADGQSSRP